jgi:hypothetical protein
MLVTLAGMSMDVIAFALNAKAPILVTLLVTLLLSRVDGITRAPVHDGSAQPVMVALLLTSMV